MKNRICCLLFMGLLLIVSIDAAQAVPFQVGDGVQSIILGNDADTSPTGRRASREIRARNVEPNPTAYRQVSFQKYDITGLKPAGKVFANCYMKIQTKCSASSSFNKNIYVYAVKEDYDNLNLGATSWSTVPGLQNTPVPPLLSQITINTLDMQDLSPLLGSCAPNSLSVLWYNTQVSANLDDVLNQDNDNTITLMFITYDVDGYFQIYGFDGAGKNRGPMICGEIADPMWARNPNPANNSTVNINISQLSWTAAEPNTPGTTLSYNVYLGTADPNNNLPDYGYMTLASSTTNTFAPVPTGLLVRDKTYYWIVDVVDSSRVPSITRGYKWTFNTNNIAPTVDAGDKQYVWLNNAGNPAAATVNLDGTVTDDGLPGPFTVQWTQVGTDPVAVTISPDNIQDITLQLPQAGTYTFMLTANDGDLFVSDTVQIFVGQTACAAAKAMPGYTAILGDFTGDCYVGLDDFAMFAANWMKCNSLAPCN